MKNNVIIGAIILLIAVLGIFAIKGSTTNSPNSTPTITQIPTKTTIKEITITASNFSYDVTKITAKKGDTVRIILKSTEGMHDLVVGGYNVATKRITEGQKETIEFVADKSGTFEYYCSVGNHRQMGMKGTLTIE